MAKKKIVNNKFTRFMYCMYSDFEYSFNYIHKDDRMETEPKNPERLSQLKIDSKLQFRAMKMQIDYDLTKFLIQSTENSYSAGQVLANGRSSGKCLKYDCLITLKDGKKKTVESLVNSEFKIKAFEEASGKFVWADAFCTYNGVKDCITIETLDFKTSVTYNHPIYTKNGWINSEDIQIGDFIFTDNGYVNVLNKYESGKHKTYSITVPDYHTHFVDGILSHNTSAIEHIIKMRLLTGANKKTGYIVFGEKHFADLSTNIKTFFDNDKFASILGFRFDRGLRMFKTCINHTSEARILGNDKTGEKQLVALHVDTCIVDEAQLVPAIALKELIPTVKKGGFFIYAGVPNDRRDTSLWSGVSNPNMIYHKYPSYESVDWDDARAERELSIHGSTSAPKYINLVEAGWNAPSFTAFDLSKIQDLFISIPDYRRCRLNVDNFEKAENELILTPKNYMLYKTYVAGMDVGYTPEHPTTFVVFGKSEHEEEDQYYMVYRGQFFGDTGNIAKIVNILINYFEPQYLGVDGQNAGEYFLSLLVNEKMFPNTYKFSESIIKKYISQSPIVLDKETNQRSSRKVHATDVFDALVKGKNVFFSSEELNGAYNREMSNMMEVLQAETKNINRSRLGGYTYENNVDEDTVDAIRFMCMAKYDIETDGLISNKKKKLILPHFIKNKYERYR